MPSVHCAEGPGEEPFPLPANLWHRRCPAPLQIVPMVVEAGRWQDAAAAAKSLLLRCCCVREPARRSAGGGGGSEAKKCLSLTCSLPHSPPSPLLPSSSSPPLLPSAVQPALAGAHHRVGQLHHRQHHALPRPHAARHEAGARHAVKGGSRERAHSYLFRERKIDHED